jgi:hypothetical protein
MPVSIAVRNVGFAGVIAALVAGCGGTSGGGARAATDEQLAIGEIWQVFRSYQKGNRPPPKGLEEILPLEAGYPTALRALKTGAVRVYWGAGLSKGPEASSTVLAYQKDVPEKGGEVLMQDGTPRKMTAEEFKAAPKAGGATGDAGVPATKK